jgi:CRP-like cAMP-binding protein
MWVYFNVDFRYSPAEVIRAVDGALQSAPIEGVSLSPEPHCVCVDFAKDRRDSFAHYAARYWLTDIARDDPTSSLVRERIYAALKRAQIPLAMPAATIWVEQDDAEHRTRKQHREIERRRKALSAVGFLKILRDDELAAIAERLRYAPFAPGEPMTKQGAVAHWLYIVVDGVAEVRVHVDGTDRVVAKIEAPGFFGEMGLMTGEPRTATVVALTEVECYRLDKEAFTRIMQDRPEIAREISGLLASRDIELKAVREHMDPEERQSCLEAEETRLLRTIQRFFGLTGHNEAA